MSLNKDEIIKILEERGANRPCDRCGKEEFSLIDKYSFMNLQDEITGAMILGGPSVPVILVACTNCGAITAHAVGALGLLPKKDKEKDANE